MASNVEFNIKDVETCTEDGSVYGDDEFSFKSDTERKNDRSCLILLALLVAVTIVGVVTTIHFSSKSSAAIQLNMATSAFNGTSDNSDSDEGERHHGWDNWGRSNKHHGRHRRGHNRTDCKNGIRTGN